MFWIVSNIEVNKILAGGINNYREIILNEHSNIHDVKSVHHALAKNEEHDTIKRITAEC